MLINEHTAIWTNKVLLVPYCHHHVTTYHDWMKDPDIQAATASEPLTIDEEYAMQQSWRSDPDKLTFISCMAPLHDSNLPQRAAEIASMLGDVNMFVSVHEEDDGDLSLVGELEVMIANKEFQRRGLGRSALLAFLNYVVQHETDIVKQFPGRASLGLDVDRFKYFAAKIKETNGRSMTLFESVGFKKTSLAPNFFGEFELRRDGLSPAYTSSMLSENGLEGYRELEYAEETTRIDS